jgi:predicted RNA-binding protein YlxR (DUF448 family)
MQGDETRKGKHVPIRMCVVCRERRPKAELARYVRTGKDRQPLPDPDQRMPGRGLYVCEKEGCRKRFASGSPRK